MKTIVIVGIATLISSTAHAESCKRLPPVADIANVNSTLIIDALSSQYIVNAECSILKRSNFPRKITFNLIPPKNNDLTIVFVRSHRILAVEQITKIKISRGSGWVMPTKTRELDDQLPRLEDEPFTGSVLEWDNAHLTQESPERINTALKKVWHAYAGTGGSSPSTREIQFWKTAEKYDLSAATLTHYLLKIPAKSPTPIPFNVGLQREVKEFTIEILSSDDSLSGRYEFKIEN